MVNAMSGQDRDDDEGFLRLEIDDMEETIRQQREELDRLRAIVERLDKTADGVPVIPTMDFVYPVDGWEYGSPAGRPPALSVYGRHRARLSATCGPHREVCKCYSTRKAAEAAAKGAI